MELPTGVPDAPMMATAGDAQPCAQHGTYTWELRDFTKLQQVKLASESFTAGGHSWKLLCFPRGNGSSGALSLYVLAADAEGWPEGLRQRADFKLTLVNKDTGARSIHKEASHNFHRHEVDWGFTLFVPRSAVLDPEAGFLQGDALTIKVELTVAPSASSSAPPPMSAPRTDSSPLQPGPLGSGRGEGAGRRTGAACGGGGSGGGLLLRVATDEDLARAQSGAGQFLDLADFSRVRGLELGEGATWGEVRRLVAQRLGVPAGRQRLWRWAQRLNGSYRPSEPVVLEEDAPVAALAGSAPLRLRGSAPCVDLYLEVLPGRGAPAPCSPGDGALVLFAKLFVPGPSGVRLRYLGRVTAHRDSRVQELLPSLVRLAGLAEGGEVQLWGEAQREEPRVVLDLMDRQATLAGCRLQHGDVLVLQPLDAGRHPALGEPIAKQLSDRLVMPGGDENSNSNKAQLPFFNFTGAQADAMLGLARAEAAQEVALLRREVLAMDAKLRARGEEVELLRQESAALAQEREELGREREELARELGELRQQALVREGDPEACRACTGDELEQALARLEEAVGRLRRQVVRRRVEEAQAEAAACMVCLSALKDTALSCGHLLCQGCSAELGSCPACRQPVTSRLRIFY